MTTENPRSWENPLSEYRALDVILDRAQVADAIKAWAIANDKIAEDGLDIPKGAHISMAVSGDRLRVSYVWRETEHPIALADAVELLMNAKTPDDVLRAREAAKEALEDWKASR